MERQPFAAPALISILGYSSHNGYSKGEDRFHASHIPGIRTKVEAR